METDATSAERPETTRTSRRTSGRSSRIELITRGEPRRRWPLEQKQAIAAESFQSGVSPTAVARRYGISSGLLYAWRKQGMEDLEQSVAEQMAGQEAATAPAAAEAQRAPKPAKRNRGALPAHLPRVELVIDVEDQTCPCCGARLRPWRSVACFWQEGFGAALRVRTDAATLLRRHVFIDTMGFPSCIDQGRRGSARCRSCAVWQRLADRQRRSNPGKSRTGVHHRRTDPGRTDADRGR
jgi:transposase